MWSPTGREERLSDGHLAYEVVCQCGTRRSVRARLLRQGRSRSCGCTKSEYITEAKTTHGMSFTRTYKSWRSMILRCENPKADNFDRYGGRGIAVCGRWRRSFENFLADMGERPEGKTLDRHPNNDGDYEPGNCRWSTPKEQAANRRKRTK